jgi:pre-mRNA-splicing factor ATP-dependent RNA helicase DHX15/PRP43
MIAIAAMASTQQPIFRRPGPIRLAADLVVQQFSNPLSDHISQLNAFHAYVNTKFEGKIPLEQWCTDHFLSHSTLEEVYKIRMQVQSQLDPKRELVSSAFEDPNYMTNIRKALALGLFNQTAFMEPGEDAYKTIHDNQHALLHAGSALVGAEHQWVVYSSFLTSGKSYLTTVTAIEPEWIMVSCRGRSWSSL